MIPQTVENFALTMICSAPVKNAMVKLTGDNTVEVAGDGDIAMGFIRRIVDKPGKNLVVVETFYTTYLPAIYTETLAAGDFTKLGAPDGDGNQRFAQWIEGTDAEALKTGLVVFGGAADTTGEMLR